MALLPSPIWLNSFDPQHRRVRSGAVAQEASLPAKTAAIGRPTGWASRPGDWSPQQVMSPSWRRAQLWVNPAEIWTGRLPRGNGTGPAGTGFPLMNTGVLPQHL